jgi:hypothetical protein
VLREQDLTAGGLVQAEDAIRMGAVAGGGCVHPRGAASGTGGAGDDGFETAQGIRLLDRGVEGVDAEALAKGTRRGWSRRWPSGGRWMVRELQWR